jgi:hypothetical protein
VISAWLLSVLLLPLRRQISSRRMKRALGRLLLETKFSSACRFTIPVSSQDHSSPARLSPNLNVSKWSQARRRGSDRGLLHAAQIIPANVTLACVENVPVLSWEWGGANPDVWHVQVNYDGGGWTPLGEANPEDRSKALDIFECSAEADLIARVAASVGPDYGPWVESNTVQATQT